MDLSPIQTEIFHILVDMEKLGVKYTISEVIRKP